MEKQIKVLVCGNTLDGTKMAASLIKFGACAFTRPDNAEAIIRSIVIDKPDVVISNINIEQDDIISVMHMVQSLLPDAPAFVVFSDLKSSFIEKQARAAGVSSFLFSPFSPDILYMAVMAALKKNIQEMCDIEIVITNMMQKIGIPANIKGYRYIRTAVIECVEDSDCLNRITKVLYPNVAKKHGTTASRVERAMRHAIGSACKKHTNAVASFLGYNTTNFNKPTNSQFISLMADKTKLLVKSNASLCIA